MDTYKIFELENYSDYRGENLINFDLSICQSLGFKLAQVNTGFSVKPYTLRGLHYQPEPYSQAKIVYCLSGSLFCVAIDLRTDSLLYGSCVSAVLSAENHKALYVPRGFALGYVTLEPNTLMQWCVDNDFKKGSMKCIRWDSLNITWPGDTSKYIINERDANAPLASEVLQ